MRPICYYGEGEPGDVKADVKKKKKNLNWGILQISGASCSNKTQQRERGTKGRWVGGRKKNTSAAANLTKSGCVGAFRGRSLRLDNTLRRRYTRISPARRSSRFPALPSFLPASLPSCLPSCLRSLPASHRHTEVSPTAACVTSLPSPAAVHADSLAAAPELIISSYAEYYTLTTPAPLRPK